MGESSLVFRIKKTRPFFVILTYSIFSASHSNRFSLALKSPFFRVTWFPLCCTKLCIHYTKVRCSKSQKLIDMLAFEAATQTNSVSPCNDFLLEEVDNPIPFHGWPLYREAFVTAAAAAGKNRRFWPTWKSCRVFRLGESWPVLMIMEWMCENANIMRWKSIGDLAANLPRGLP